MMLDELIAFLRPSVFSYHEKLILIRIQPFNKITSPKDIATTAILMQILLLMQTGAAREANRCRERGKQVQREGEREKDRDRNKFNK